MIDPDEWDTLCLLIEEGWPGEFTDAAAKAWRVFLDDYDAGQVLAAVKILVARGGRFRPSVAEVAAQIRQDPSAPTFEEAYALIYSPKGILWGRSNGAAKEFAQRGVHPLVGSFAVRYGIERLRMLEVDHETYGSVKRKELRDAWDRHLEASEGRDLAALMAPREKSLGRLDPLAALGASRPELGSGDE